MPDQTNVSDDDRLKAFLESGSSITGEAAGAAIGLIVGGLPGAVIGAAGSSAVSAVLKHGAQEFLSRALSKRESTRVATALDYAANRVTEKLRLNYELRTDGFFRGDPAGRSFGDEIVEGVLLAAQREHEERKIEHLGLLLANLAFDGSVSRVYANLLVATAEQLSYTQLCLLRLFAVKDRFSLRLGDYRGGTQFALDLIAVLQETHDLESRNLLNTSGEVLFGLTDVKPTAMTVQGAGATLHDLMELHRIRDGDLLPLAALLS